MYNCTKEISISQVKFIQAAMSEKYAEMLSAQQMHSQQGEIYDKKT